MRILAIQYGISTMRDHFEMGMAQESYQWWDISNMGMWVSEVYRAEQEIKREVALPTDG